MIRISQRAVTTTTISITVRTMATPSEPMVGLKVSGGRGGTTNLPRRSFGGGGSPDNNDHRPWLTSYPN